MRRVHPARRFKKSSSRYLKHPALTFLKISCFLHRCKKHGNKQGIIALIPVLDAAIALFRRKSKISIRSAILSCQKKENRVWYDFRFTPLINVLNKGGDLTGNTYLGSLNN
jgi:hypothetical protein